MLTIIFFAVAVMGGTFLLFAGALVIQFFENMWNHLKELFHPTKKTDTTEEDFHLEMRDDNKGDQNE